MQNETTTHAITFSKKGELPRPQGACGKTDLFNILRAMMRDGFTDFKITTVESVKPEPPRPRGYYWVKMSSEWEIAHYDEETKDFTLIGSDDRFSKKEFREISTSCLRPNDKNI